MQCSFKDITTLFNNSEQILITGHIQPDGDCLGSMLALYLYLQDIGKNVQVVLDDDIPLSYRFLPSIQTIIKPDKSLYSQADLMIVLDASDIERVGSLSTQISCPILNIDHHKSNTKFAEFTYLDLSAAATGEIICNLFNYLNYNPTAAIANCLYTAIATDCGFFRYANTTSSTLRNAALLVEHGAQPNFISDALQMRTPEYITILTAVLQTLEFFHDKQIAAITVDLAKYPLLDSEGFIDYPRYIEGVRVAVMFKIVDVNTVRVSLRSTDIDVSKIALTFGGGGHLRAAGCTFSGNYADAKNQVLSLIASNLKDD